MTTPNWHGYPCPVCNAGRGETCVSPVNGKPLARSHYYREPQALKREPSPDEATLQALTNWIVAGNP